MGVEPDAIGAGCGQIAGAFYGIEGMPSGWLGRLAKRDLIESLASKLSGVAG